MAFTFAVLFAVKKGANLLGATSPMSYLAKKLLGKLINFGLKAYIVKEFGEAAGEFFDNIDQLADKIEDVGRKSDFSCEDTEEIAAEIARMLADIALESPAKLKDFFNRVKLKRPKIECDEPDTREEHKECYKSINGFESLNLSVSDINRLERELGVKSSYCETK